MRYIKGAFEDGCQLTDVDLGSCFDSFERGGGRTARKAPTIQQNVRASKGRSWTADRQTGGNTSTNERRRLNRTICTTVTWIISPV
ncbi:hypothetical protein J6590_040811 [Homalodisca vitripennis]|nr:hypothetical protein J6590_040811 [Homalodisca vitripennis]